MPENKEKELLRRWMALWAEIDKTYIGFLKRWDLSLNAYWVIEYLHNHPQGAEPARCSEPYTFCKGERNALKYV